MLRKRLNRLGFAVEWGTSNTELTRIRCQPNRRHRRAYPELGIPSAIVRGSTNTRRWSCMTFTLQSRHVAESDCSERDWTMRTN